MSSISKVCIFVCSNSQACQTAMNYIREKRIPDVMPIFLDEPNVRKRVMNGEYIQIKVVPTLMLIMNQGPAQLFIGVDKIIEFFEDIIRKNQQQNNFRDIQDEPLEEEEPPKKKSSMKKPRGKPKKKVSIASPEYITLDTKPKIYEPEGMDEVRTKSKKRSKGGSSVADIAAQMKAERDRQLGTQSD